MYAQHLHACHPQMSERVSDTLELELQKVGSHQMGAGNLAQVLRTSSRCS